MNEVIICGSMKFSQEMVEAAKKIEILGHIVCIPEFAENYTKLNSSEEAHTEAEKNKV